MRVTDGSPLQGEHEVVHLISMRPPLSLGSVVRIPVTVLVMVVVSGGLMFLTRLAGLGGSVSGYAAFFGALVAAWATLRGLGRLMSFRGTQAVTFDGRTVTLSGLNGRSVEFPVDDVVLRKGDNFKRFVSRLALRQPPTVEEEIEGGEDRLMHAREIWAATQVHRLQPKFALLSLQAFEQGIESGQAPAWDFVSYVTLFVQGKRLVALKVDIDTSDDGDRTSATLHRVF